MGRDHSIECEVCGCSYGGFNGPEECQCRGEKLEGRALADYVHTQECCNDHELHHCDFEKYTKLCRPCARLVNATLATLAHNLAIGAALCRAYRYGALNGSADVLGRGWWWPGCGKRAP